VTPTGELPEQILTYLRDEAKRPLKARELAKALAVPESEYRAFREELRGLEADGLVYRGRRGRYATPENINLAVGRIQITRAGDGFVNVAEGDDVFVRGHNLHTAVDGDTVVARVERRRPGRNPEGRVIRVLERAWHQVVGVYHSKRSYGFVIPQEPALTADLFVPPGSEADAEDGQMVLVEVLEWGERELSPVGRIERVIGTPGEAGVDVLAILLGHQLPLEFPAAVVREAKAIAAGGLGTEADKGREDLRDTLVFTIDPEDAKDHDDAISWTPATGGGAEVGVHIADVSHYVRQGSELDREALERGTSVYLVDRVVPMLPHELSSDLCSLKPGVDRLALSILFGLDASGRITGSRTARTIIRNRRGLSYDEAQGILDDQSDSSELALALRALHGFSRRLRRQREKRGSIDFDLPEARVVLNRAGEPTDIERVLRLASHELIEDLMILANETVAELAISQRLPLIFRVHESPKEDRIEALRGLAASFGYQLPQRDVTPKDLAKLLKEMEDTPQKTLVSTATLRSMKQARYAPENLRHFGLASPAYTHFTSPIRRYPDLVVHRQIVRWMSDPTSAREVEVERLGSIAERSSASERRAVAAERDSVDLKKIQFMERHLGDEFAGTIAGVTAFGMFVLLEDFHVEGLVHVSSLGDDYYVFDEEQHALSGRRTRKRYQLGDPVLVQVVRVDREARKIDFDLLEHRAAGSAAGDQKTGSGGATSGGAGGGKTPAGKGGRPHGSTGVKGGTARKKKGGAAGKKKSAPARKGGGAARKKKDAAAGKKKGARAGKGKSDRNGRR
jgi:ribonuclease R